MIKVLITQDVFGNWNCPIYVNKGSGDSCNMLDCQGNFGNTALHIAAHCGRIEMTTYLLDKGFDVNKMNELSETPLHLAASGYYSGG
mgnify:CR=1 FL=1